MKTSKKTEKDLVIDEWRSLYYNVAYLETVNNILYPKTFDMCCGNKVNHIKESNYRQIYETLFINNNYSILMIDGGIITYFYEFDENENIKSHCLHYLPSIEIESDDDDMCHLFSDYSESNILSKYVRIDFGKEGFKEYIHSECHIHFSLNKDSIRIPCESWISPKEFFMFILTYIYQEPFDINKTNKRQILTDNEKLKYYLKIGS